MYNTRKSTGGYTGPKNAPSVNTVGQRRPPPNFKPFVQGEQLTPQNQAFIQMPEQQQKPVQPQQPANPQAQQKPPMQQQQKPAQPQAAAVTPQQQQPKSAGPVQQQPKTVGPVQQQQQKSAAPIQQQQKPAAPTQQQQQKPAGPIQQQQTKPAGSVQQQQAKPAGPVPQQQAKPAGPSQQQENSAGPAQQKPAVVPNQQQQVKPVPAPAANVVQQPAKPAGQQNVAAQLKPAPASAQAQQVVVKEEKAAPVAVPVTSTPTAPPAPVIKNAEAMDTTTASSVQSSDGDSQVEGFGHFMRGKKMVKFASGKISKSERNRRRNNRFRKMLQPKNALMVLNELSGSPSFTFTEVAGGGGPGGIVHAGGGNLFRATTEINGVTYSGVGTDKNTAKSVAAENALKDLMLQKLMTPMSGGSNGNANNGNAAEAEDVTAVDGAVDDKMEGVEEQLPKDGDEATEMSQKDVPWAHLASFALHKLFTSWEDAGELVKQMRPTLTTTGDIKAEETKVKPLPEGSTQMHPVMLLNQMRPGVVAYTEAGMEGTLPHALFHYICMVDNQRFEGVASTKKMARRNAAYKACETVLGVQYDETVKRDIEESSKIKYVSQVPNAGAGPQPKKKFRNNRGRPQQMGYQQFQPQEEMHMMQNDPNFGQQQPWF